MKAVRRARKLVTGDEEYPISDHLKSTPVVKMIDRISFTAGKRIFKKYFVAGYFKPRLRYHELMSSMKYRRLQHFFHSMACAYDSTMVKYVFGTNEGFSTVFLVYFFDIIQNCAIKTRKAFL